MGPRHSFAGRREQRGPLLCRCGFRGETTATTVRPTGSSPGSIFICSLQSVVWLDSEIIRGVVVRINSEKVRTCHETALISKDQEVQKYADDWQESADRLMTEKEMLEKDLKALK